MTDDNHNVVATGWVRVAGKFGWKPAAKVCPCFVLSHTACYLFNSFSSSMEVALSLQTVVVMG